MVPRPVTFCAGSGVFALRPDTPLRYDPDSDAARRAAGRLHDELLRRAGVRLPQPVAAGPAGSRPAIRLVAAAEGEGASHPEGYRLTVAPDGVLIEARELAGFLHGGQTLLQLVPETPDAAGPAWSIPGARVADWPRFRWRGLMLDACRHFMPVASVLKFLDAMALHKLNVFHWHLTEDQGWRVEIARHPKLTAVSAWRRETVVGHAGQSAAYDNRPHGGFYTREDLRAVVAYAAERGIRVMPEIEMPGHARAALAAYPELSCTGGPHEVATTFGIVQDVFCAGNDATLRFLKEVMEEVLGIFPGAYVHVGGDECPKDRWKACPKCQARIRAEGLKDEHELQSWFIRQMDAFLQERGRRLVGWDEILEGGLAAGAVVMSWRGEEGGIAAVQAGHDVIMAPNQKVYFDYYQAAERDREPLAIGGCLPLDQVYGYEPIPAALRPDQASRVLGAQGQLWSEYLGNWPYVEYMAFPRAIALAEVLWSPAAGKNYTDFRRRLSPHLRRLDRLGINYRQPEALV
jgi:hexosaminidase